MKLGYIKGEDYAPTNLLFNEIMNKKSSNYYYYC